MSNVQFGALNVTQTKGWNNLLMVKPLFNPNEPTYQHKSVSVEITGKDVARFNHLAPYHASGTPVATLGIYPKSTPLGTHFKVALSNKGSIGFANLFPKKKAEFSQILTLIDEAPKLSKAKKYELTKNLMKEALNVIA